MTAAAYVRAAVAKGDGFEMYRALFDCPLFRPTRSGGREDSISVHEGAGDYISMDELAMVRAEMLRQWPELTPQVVVVVARAHAAGCCLIPFQCVRRPPTPMRGYSRWVPVLSGDVVWV